MPGALEGVRVLDLSHSNGGHPLVDALYGVFPTADGYIAMAGCPDHLWPKLVECVEHPELAENPRFGRYFTTPEIKAELREAFEVHELGQDTEPVLLEAGNRPSPTRARRWADERI
jgi:crotonobetainyl-CoA:carnitine CoA-transferase CaiB-like acyl-CoA transferase